MVPNKPIEPRAYAELLERHLPDLIRPFHALGLLGNAPLLAAETLLSRLRQAGYEVVQARGACDDERADLRETQAALQGALDSAADTNRVLAKRLADAVAVLKGYETWEAALINCDAAWATRTGQPFPTEELYDGMMDLQHERNKVLEANEPQRKEPAR